MTEGILKHVKVLSWKYIKLFIFYVHRKDEEKKFQKDVTLN